VINENKTLILQMSIVICTVFEKRVKNIIFSKVAIVNYYRRRHNTRCAGAKTTSTPPTQGWVKKTKS
jgi:hypothetical protein